MIYINGRFLLQNQTGVNRFAYELCQAFSVLGIDFTLLCPRGTIKSCYNTSTFKIVQCGIGNSHGWEQLSLPFIFSKIKGEKILLCFTGIGPVWVRNKIMTIHDLAFMVNPKWYSPQYVWLYKWLTPLAAKTSKKIITVSHFSKREIVRLLSLKESKIEVVYNAVASTFKPEIQSSHILPRGEKYVLAVSSIDPRKNFQTLLKAFSLLKNTDVDLYIVGGQSHVFASSIKELYKEIPNNRIKWLGRVSDEELKTYYKNAVCFIYPSLYEGFGIPPLEAMACGTPTIVSDIEPIREVCADASIYVNPYDEQDIAKKITKLISNTSLQQSLRQAGLKRYSVFDWKTSAKQLFAIINTETKSQYTGK